MTEREMKRKAAARRARARKARNRRVALTICLMLAVSLVSIGGTIAWLQDKTEVVTNTFTPSDINIWMTETVNGNEQSTENGQPITNSTFKIVPGNTEAKDPTVVVKTDSEECWVFIKVTEVGGVVTPEGSSTATAFEDFIPYDIDDEWTALDGYDGVYYTTWTPGTDNEIEILSPESITYPTTITKEMMNALNNVAPQLTFQAAAVQKANIDDFADAFNQVKADLGFTVTP